MYSNNNNSSDSLVHPLAESVCPPERFTFPFNYRPHPLCVKAAKELQTYIAGQSQWHDEIERGKMFGVLVVRQADGKLGYLTAYSGLLAGRNDWSAFVPPVYDSQQPDGYFKTHEHEISMLNAEIAAMQSDSRLAELRHELEVAQHTADDEIRAYKALMHCSKQRRDALRHSQQPLSKEEETALLHESQYQKAELKRLKQRHSVTFDSLRCEISAIEQRIMDKKHLRKSLSDSLQHWLFTQYVVENANGEQCDLCHIFASTPQGVPPSGAGDCCAPKLLQYAYTHSLKPLCMAEFWWGQSPKTEIRHHLHYYPACRSKCKPILTFMMQGLRVDPDPHGESNETMSLRIVYEDESIVVVSKPSGMLSVPGRVARQSVVDKLAKERPGQFLMPAHRLDMATSGLLVVAKTADALRSLHAQFADRHTKKRYVAVLDGVAKAARRGTITLPLAPDPVDSPRQMVDMEHGKEAVTDYEIVEERNNRTLVRLFPHTGRTHQLRIHCAHPDGLGVPILGDELYGHPNGGRLFLHAEYIAFHHPATGEWVEYSERADWRS